MGGCEQWSSTYITYSVHAPWHRGNVLICSVHVSSEEEIFYRKLRIEFLTACIYVICLLCFIISGQKSQENHYVLFLMVQHKLP